MSEFVKEDWKLKAHAEVKLRRENTNMLVSLMLRPFESLTVNSAPNQLGSKTSRP